MMRHTIRKLTANDVPAGMILSQSAGWNQTPQDWRRLLLLEPHGCFVAESDGQVIGTVTTTTYGRDLAWIGMMLVDEGHRRQGIATALMRAAVDYLRGVGITKIKLDATPAGEPVYENLGFCVERRFHRYRRVRNRDAKLQRPDRNHQLTQSHLELDREAFSADRSKLLRILASESHVVTLPAGYGLLRYGILADYLGPLVSRDVDSAIEIVAKLLQLSRAENVFCDLIHRESDRIAEECGFVQARTLARMCLGAPSDEMNGPLQIAIADPGIG